MIFDWGGVLVDDPAPGIISYCCRTLQVQARPFVDVCRDHVPGFQEGLITEDVFWRDVCAGLEIPPPTVDSLWGDAFRYAYSPKPEMFELARSLSENGCKTALLSNTEVPAVKYFHELEYDMFHVTLFSCEAKARKPERQIYDLVVAELGVRPAEAILIDDRPENIEGAQRIGMNTILFESPSATMEELTAFSFEQRA